MHPHLSHDPWYHLRYWDFVTLSTRPFFLRNLGDINSRLYHVPSLRCCGLASLKHLFFFSHIKIMVSLWSVQRCKLLFLYFYVSRTRISCTVSRISLHLSMRIFRLSQFSKFLTWERHLTDLSLYYDNQRSKVLVTKH